MKTTASKIKINDQVKNNTMLYTIKKIKSERTKTGKELLTFFGPYTYKSFNGKYTNDGAFSIYATSKVTILNR